MASHNNQYATPPAGSAAVSNSMMMAMMRDNNNNSGVMMTGGGGANAKSNGAGHFLNQLEARMGQILDDADHKRCSEGNQRALLAEKLENLRRLTKDLEKDEWMYAPKKMTNGLTLSNIPPRKSSPF